MLYDFGTPAWNDQYRQQTANSKAMTGVTSPTFKCRKCKTNQSTLGRKQYNKGFPKDGYLCAECAKGRK